MTVDERARAGLFLAMQYPVEVPGVSVSQLPAHRRRPRSTARRRSCAPGSRSVQGRDGAARRWTRRSPSATSTRASPAARRSGTRSCSSSCSSRRSRSSTRPTPASTSTRCGSSPRASTGSATTGETGVLLITHYTRILRYIKPDFVHVFVGGRIVEEGGPELADAARGRGLRALPAGAARRHDLRRDRACDPTGSDALRRRARSARTSRSSTARSTATAAGLPRQRGTPRRSRGRCSTRCASYYERHNANVHRGVHTLGQEATEAYEGARDKVAAFIGAPTGDEVVFTKNSTEAHQPGRLRVRNAAAARRPAVPLGPGDEVVITEMEHHSNIVPWQLLCERTGATLRWFGITDEGRLDLSDLDELINERTKVVVVRARVQHPRHGQPGRRRSSDRAREVGALVVLDALAVGAAHAGRRAGARRRLRRLHRAQDAAARPASACCGAAASCSTRMPPFLGGGSMIETVTMAGSTFAAAAAPVRGRHAADRPGGRARRGGRLPDRRSAWTRSHAHEQAHHRRTRWTRLPTVAGRADHRPGDADRPRRRDLVRARRRPPARRRPGARRRSASRSGSGTTAPGRCACASACRRRPGRRSTSTRRPPRSTRWSTASSRCRQVLRR